MDRKPYFFKLIAEYTAVPAERVAPIPRRLDLFHAGAIPITGLTALQGIDDVVDLRRDEHTLIHGASGGVGTLVIQFARLRHARVFASVSGEDGVSLALRLGAHAAVNGKAQDIAEAARRFAPKGVEAVLALAGWPGFQKCLDATRDRSRVAYPNGELAARNRADVRSLIHISFGRTKNWEGVKGGDLVRRSRQLITYKQSASRRSLGV